MSDFVDMLVEMLPMHSELQRGDNPFRKVLDRTVGEYMDNFTHIFDELFLETASGGWLDCFGRDFGVPRRIDESDDDYRERIVFDKLEYCNAPNLINIYGLILYCLVDDFDASENTLTSDNPYVDTGGFMAEADTDLRGILDGKFVIGRELVWL